jgi:pyruvate,water dikinase
MDSEVVDLTDLPADAAVSIVGPKIGRLVELAALGMRVPQGFAVTEAAHRRYLAQTGVGTVIDAVLARLPKTPTSSQLQSASSAIVAAISATPVPPWLTGVVAGGYKRLSSAGGDPNIAVAVRSSASVEDGARNSFAGVFASRLGVAGAAEIAAAVVEIWASVYGTRALAYARQQLSSDARIVMAVGVLELVNATSSGVAFSAHPVTGRTDRLVIEATWGLGQDLVEGVVTPDHIEVGKTDLRILRHEIGSKNAESIWDRALNRVVRRPVARDRRRAPALTPLMISELAKTVVQIEGLCGFPVDVEWVIRDSPARETEVVVVQTRPATSTLRPAVVTNGWDAAFTNGWDAAFKSPTERTTP